MGLLPFLMVRDGEHYSSVYLPPVIEMSVHVICPWKSWIILFDFFLPYIKRSSLILDMMPWPDVVCRFFSLSVFSFCVHLLNKLFHRGKVFNIDEVQFIDFSLL